VALSLAGQALSSALRPLGTLAGDILGSATSAANIARGAAGVTVNISTPNAASFQQSQSQVASVVARAVARGQRNL
jgi:ribosomal protein S3